MAKRTRYQYGSVEIDKRITGPDVWLYRWWETTSDGRKTRRGFTVGTVEEYKTQAQALKAAEWKRLLVNDGIASRAPVLFGAVLGRFLLEQKQEEEAEQITHSTYVSYRSMISQHIRPKWGDVSLQDVRPALVQDWLRKLSLSPKYKGHIRSLMYRLFDRAMIWELIGIDRNPMQLVEVKGISKRRQRPRNLQVKEAWRILDALSQPYRTIVLIALCFGLRVSEILGLRWTDFDFKRSAVLIQRSSVGKRLNKLKTECSQDEVPLERGFVVELKKWQELCLESEGQWLFPSPVTGRPLHADSIRADYLIPTSLQLGLGRIGFHTFRHTYRAWLDETGAPVGVQQKLMRHAHISTTMDQYGNASMEAKRRANRPLVQRLLKRSAGNEPAFIQ
ncbi:MAG: tyrosine-type recombinase/integrase [Candidatus Korobacteraceae bacterium]